VLGRLHDREPIAPEALAAALEVEPARLEPVLVEVERLGFVRVDGGECCLSERGHVVYGRLVDAGRVELAALVPKQDGDGDAAPVIRRLAESLVADMPEYS
jgi:hypothetical protein